MKNFIILFLVPVKRIIFFITKIITHFYGGLFWLLNSKEHTNFSLKLDAENLKATLQNLHNFIKMSTIQIKVENDKNNNQNIIDVSDSIKIIELKNKIIESFISFSRSIKPDKKTYKNIFKTIDLDFKSKWDYRLIPFSILFGTDVNNVYEFGFDQGRLPLLISKYIESHNIENKRYIGVDFNTRKGILIPESKYIEIHPKRVEDFLPDYKSLEALNNSILVASTHEEKSEKFIFDYLDKNNIGPKFIISDEVSKDSPYINFVTKNNYKNTTFIFLDNKNFLEPLIIGLSRKA